MSKPLNMDVLARMVAALRHRCCIAVKRQAAAVKGHDLYKTQLRGSRIRSLESELDDGVWM
jgi:hypothetical protein